MVYQANFERLKPPAKSFSTAAPLKLKVPFDKSPIGVEDKFHANGELMSMVDCEPSKSSTYMVDSLFKLVKLGVSGLKKATSPLNDKFDGTSVS